MLRKIETLLRLNPGLKARSIAAEIGEDRSAVNATLYANLDRFFQDGEFQWFLTSQRELTVELGTGRWMTATDFERAVGAVGSPLDSPLPIVKFVLARGSKLMIDALARLLALSNQLVGEKKEVVLDFSQCGQTLSYLDRVGFFNHLHNAVAVLPTRPGASLSTVYEGNNDGVVELLEINPANPNQNIPRRLGHSFVRCAGAEYEVGAFTVLAELFRNVEEHSEAAVPGFAGLQYYKRSRHIQAVISDSGIGIVGSLQPVLADRYPKIAKKIARSRADPGVALLMQVFSEGGLSQVQEEGRGLGLKQSSEVARKYRAEISVRQETFELRVFHDTDGIRFKHSLGLPRLRGTHICFDLKLDGSSKSA